ncbi:MAG: DNA adenine methylase, partial [Cyanobacteria bacterium P01_H01_bin.130]
MTIHKSPLRYMGGKQQYAQQLVEMLPPCTEYREPFLGGASVLLAMRQLRPYVQCWGNDLYPLNYNFWRSVT